MSLTEHGLNMLNLCQTSTEIAKVIGSDKEIKFSLSVLYA